MNRVGIVAALLALLVSFAPPVLASDVTAFPQWTSDQVRAARPSGPEDALVFDLRTEISSVGAPTRITASTVTLTPTYTYVFGGQERTLDDFALCRTYAWSATRPVLGNVSCYALPAFRVIELANRRVLAAMKARLSRATGKAIANSDNDPYWREAELAVQQAPDTPLVVQRAGDTTEYRFQGESVVRIVGSVAQLKGDEPKRLSRFLARNAPLHPQPRHDLAASSNLPARLEIEFMTAAKKQHEVLTISNVRRSKLAFPLPAGLQSDLRTGTAVGDTPMAHGVRQSLLATDGVSKIPKPTPEALLADLRDASSHGRSAEVLLRFLQFTQQYPSRLMGPDRQVSISEIAPLVRQALQNPTAVKLYQAGALAGGPQVPGDREAAARYLASATGLDRVPFGTFRYVTFANLIRVSPDASKRDPAIFKAMPSPLVANYWTHIAAYPWASGAYKDAGDTYFASYDTPNAWLAYDLGRAVDPDWRSGPMAYVAHNEDLLRSSQPDFF